MIRRAASEDSLAMGKVYCLSWQEGYKDILPKDFLDSLTTENCAPNPGKINPKNIFLAENGTDVIGLVNYGGPRDQNVGNMGEIRSIYVLADSWGSGAGCELFQAARTDLEKLGYDGFYLWVLKENHRARRFYEKMGMICTNEEREIEIGGESFTECRFIYDGTE